MKDEVNLERATRGIKNKGNFPNSLFFGIFLTLSLIREIYYYQISLDSFLPLVLCIIFWFRFQLHSRLIFIILVICILSISIQFYQESLINLLYLSKVLILTFFSILVYDWFSNSKNHQETLRFLILICCALTFIEYFFMAGQSRVLLSGLSVIRLHGIYGHHNYSAIIYMVFAFMAWKNGCHKIWFSLMLLGVLTGSNSFYLYMIAAMAVFIFPNRLAQSGLFILHWCFWTLPLWIADILNLLSTSQYKALALFTNFRSVHWDVYSNMAMDNIWSGVGFQRGLELYSQYTDPSVDWFNRAQIQHNLSLEILVSMGALFWFLTGLCLSFVILRSNSKSQLFLAFMLFFPYVLLNALTFVGLWVTLAFWFAEHRQGKRWTNHGIN